MARQLPSRCKSATAGATAREVSPNGPDAKHLVINPGTAQVAAIIGSPNFTDSAFDGRNLEAAAVVTGRTAQAAAQVVQSDWTAQPAGAGPRQQLVLSPDATATWLHLF